MQLQATESSLLHAKLPQHINLRVMIKEEQHPSAYSTVNQTTSMQPSYGSIPKRGYSRSYQKTTENVTLNRNRQQCKVTTK